MWDAARLGLLVQDNLSGCGTAELGHSFPGNGDKSSASCAEQGQDWELSQVSFGGAAV